MAILKFKGKRAAAQEAANKYAIEYAPDGKTFTIYDKETGLPARSEDLMGADEKLKGLKLGKKAYTAEFEKHAKTLEPKKEGINGSDKSNEKSVGGEKSGGKKSNEDINKQIEEINSKWNKVLEESNKKYEKLKSEYKNLVDISESKNSDEINTDNSSLSKSKASAGAGLNSRFNTPPIFGQELFAAWDNAQPKPYKKQPGEVSTLIDIQGPLYGVYPYDTPYNPYNPFGAAIFGAKQLEIPPYNPLNPFAGFRFAWNKLFK